MRGMRHIGVLIGNALNADDQLGQKELQPFQDAKRCTMGEPELGRVLCEAPAALCGRPDGSKERQLKLTIGTAVAMQPKSKLLPQNWCDLRARN
jgi:hypothetical protein